MTHWQWIAGVLVVGCILQLAPAVEAQSVQAGRGLQGQRRALELAAAHRFVSLLAASTATPNFLATQLESLSADGRRAVDALDLQVKRAMAAANEKEFEVEFERLRNLTLRLLGESARDSEGGLQSLLRGQVVDVGVQAQDSDETPPRLSDAIPQVLKRRDVDFAVGVRTAGRRHAGPTQSLTIATNLGGAAAGAVLAGLSEGLQKYFTDFTSMDVQLPLAGESRIASTIGLGLGEFTFGRVYVWPVLAMEQLNPDDERIPDAVADSNPDTKQWSTPALGLGVALKGRATSNHGIDPVVTASVGIPHYYPGGGFSALAALFSDNRHDFQKGGKVRLSVGIATTIPRLGGSAP